MESEEVLENYKVCNVTDTRLEMTGADTGNASCQFSVTILNTVHKFFAPAKDEAALLVENLTKTVAY